MNYLNYGDLYELMRIKQEESGRGLEVRNPIEKYLLSPVQVPRIKELHIEWVIVMSRALINSSPA